MTCSLLHSSLPFPTIAYHRYAGEGAFYVAALVKPFLLPSLPEVAMVLVDYQY